MLDVMLDVILYVSDSVYVLWYILLSCCMVYNTYYYGLVVRGALWWDLGG